MLFKDHFYASLASTKTYNFNTGKRFFLLFVLFLLVHCGFAVLYLAHLEIFKSNENKTGDLTTALDI